MNFDNLNTKSLVVVLAALRGMVADDGYCLELGTNQACKCLGCPEMQLDRRSSTKEEAQIKRAPKICDAAAAVHSRCIPMLGNSQWV